VFCAPANAARAERRELTALLDAYDEHQALIELLNLEASENQP
jgi:hypothetical protein